MLYYETISSSTLELLKKLTNIDVFTELRLVGGTALALQLGHRTSIDLDFFGCDINEDFISIITALKKNGIDLNIIRQSSNIFISIMNNVKVDIVNYPYNWIDKVHKEGDLVLATPKDIAAMKLAAITNRGSKKDFIDLYYLLDIYSLEKMIEFYNQKYNDGSVFMLLKSLSYFDDADEEVMPKMFDTTLTWKTVKKKITEETKTLV
ncbi:MAG: nucleotidyl transferase AbiEii/AbiGii toxin family protein [Kiritimatiellae bacterium]|jgi:hypothetical protein|nr:nucleotidyl transferase AbiEii/AbiGii toxin family protein [Kiritimatiellia bacterium]